MPTPPHPSPPGPERLLTSSAHEGARRLCQWLAHDAGLAVTEIDADGKPGIAARHHLRVTLRLLRVTLDAYDSVLEDAAPRKLSRRAATLARLVGAARDHDVQDGLLASVTRTRTATQRKALARLEHDLTRDGGLDATAIRHRWGRLAKSLRNGLSSWQESHRLDGPRGPLPFAHVAADALERAADRAARRCGRVTATSDIEVIHLARIGLKIVRYLMAPLAPGESDAAAMIAVLRDAQHHLGTICDAHLLRVRIIEARMTGPTPRRCRRAPSARSSPASVTSTPESRPHSARSNPGATRRRGTASLCDCTPSPQAGVQAARCRWRSSGSGCSRHCRHVCVD